MLIPKKLTILGHTIKVKRVKVLPKQKDCRGLWLTNKNLIYVQIQPGNVDLEEQTFYHELVHAILDNLLYIDLSEDENLVDRVGSALHQALKTMEY